MLYLIDFLYAPLVMHPLDLLLNKGLERLESLLCENGTCIILPLNECFALLGKQVSDGSIIFI